MSDNQPDPIDAGTAIERAQDAIRDALATAADTKAGSALTVTGTDAAVAVKAQLASAHARIAIARRNALDAQETAKVAIRRQQDELQRRIWAMDKELEPLMAQVALLSEGIATINLYLGRDEEIVTLANGRPAPASTPVHVRQQVLAMDEESALDAGTGGMDVRNIEAFDRWITADPAHLAQVLPELRGVVAIMARRETRDYGDPWANRKLNDANHQTWWLIRNGENLYRMLTEFNVGRRLVPARNEFTSMFVDVSTKEPLVPGSRAWLEAEKRAGARERHFMKIALILQGLIDRTAVFAPLPVAGLSLLAPDRYDAGHVVLIADDENQITSGRVPFYQWLAAKNAQLTPGMRVIVNVNHEGWPSRYDYGEHPRIRPSRAESPSATAVHTIKKRVAGGDLTFTYPRTVKEWLDDGYGRETLRAPSTPASCMISPGDKFVLPIDLVSVAEMDEYLGARTERHAYASMFPTLHAAIAFKKAEAAQEAPFRALLAAQVAAADCVTTAEAEPIVDELVAWWKVANRWNRALNGEPAAEVKAARMILAEHAARLRASDDSSAAAAVLATLKARHPGALFIARKKDGTWVVATASKRRWANPTDKESNRYGVQVSPLDVFVDLQEYTSKTGRPGTASSWQILEPSVVGRWTMPHTSPAWDAWNRRARRSELLSDPEIDHLVDLLAAQETARGQVFVAASYNEGGNSSSWGAGKLTAYFWDGTVPSAPVLALTGAWPRVETPGWVANWRRSADGRLMLTGRRRTSGNWFLRPGSSRVETPWGGSNETKLIVRRDQDTIDKVEVMVRALASEQAAVEPLRRAAETLLTSLETAWLAQRTAEAKARFLEDYADMTLWDDHAKSLKLVYPYGRNTDHRPAGAARRAVTQAVNELVETGTAPWGLTVADVVTGVELPADLAVLRFADGPEPDRA
jgi:hypothetical protein